MNQPSHEAMKRLYAYCRDNVIPNIPDDKKQAFLAKKKAEKEAAS